MISPVSESSPFFSVIIPCFNRAEKARVAVRSVLEQSWRDYEVIVVDDGSSDNLQAALADFDDPRIRYVWRPNGGAGPARNTGLAEARGAYVSLLDSDDRFLPGHLQQTFEAIQGHPGANVFFSQVFVDRGVGRTFLKPPRGPGSSEDIPTYLMCDRGFIPVSSTTIETELARKVGFTVVRGTDEDLDFMLRLSRSGGRFVMMDAPTAWIDDRPAEGRVSGARRAEQCLGWLASIRSTVGERAYYGYRGWHAAKVIAPDAPLKALWMYVEAVVRGAYSLRMAITVLLQLVLPRRAYERLSARVLNSRKLLALSGFKHGHG